MTSRATAAERIDPDWRVVASRVEPGVVEITVQETVAAAGSLPTTSGVLVTGIATGSPADAAGLVAGTGPWHSTCRPSAWVATRLWR